MSAEPSTQSQPTSKITVVTPAYNEEHNLPALHERLSAVMEGVENCDFEVLLIDNCSTDGTEAAARRIVEADSRWRYLRFSRNFGFEVSLAAGMHYATGDALIFLPSDLQDPPERIPEMIERWREGYDVVYGQLRRRSDQNPVKTMGARLFYKVVHKLSDVRLPENATDFRLLSRPAIEALKRCGERNRYLRGLAHWVGFKQSAFVYDRDPRKHGQSSTDFAFLTDFALNAIVVFSTRPLRLASMVGLGVTALSVLGAITYFVLFLLSGAGMIDFVPPPPGWTTQTLVIFFFGGVQCLFLGVIGEYLAKIHTEVRRRPLWVLHESAGFPEEQDPLSNEPVHV
jgi:polyisoprenyl-phosphate glycosyltransferase